MEGLPKIKLTEVEQKAHDAAEKRLRILNEGAGEKAVAGLNQFLANEGITEEEWKKQSEMRGRKKERG
ncbi:MAG: hypothetical protein Q7R73_03195 [bacterium]|nr:hypothetical protein [bacterium]